MLTFLFCQIHNLHQLNYILEFWIDLGKTKKRERPERKYVSNCCPGKKAAFLMRTNTWDEHISTPTLEWIYSPQGEVVNTLLYVSMVF